ncbi:HAD-IIIA family hydrolase [bacterium]|nr:HAD-IIIA family hydrolase [bacterium]
MDLNQALFLDRDGTIIKDCEGVLTEDSIEFEDGLKDFLMSALNSKFKIIMVTNQTSVSRGLTTFTEMKKVNNILIKKINYLLGKNVFNAVYICPFHPDAQVLKYRLDSQDRKPKPGMFYQAKKHLKINLKKSIMVGDRISDILAGNLSECITVMKLNKFSNLKMIKTNLKYSHELTIPNYKVNKLKEIIPIMEKLI